MFGYVFRSLIAGLLICPAWCGADVFDVYIAAGQSNMDGRGNNSQLTGGLLPFAAPQPDVLLNYTRPSDGPGLYQTGWVTLAPGYSVPPGFDNPLPSSRFGPEVSFGKAVDNNTTERKVAIIKVSAGGTNLSSDWDPSDAINGPKGYMYSGFETAVPQAIQALQALGHSVEVRGMIWHQGESDGSSDSQATHDAYEANLTEFIQSVRQDLGYANLPFIIGELESVEGGREAVRTAQADVAAAMNFVEFVSSTGLAVADGTHFTTESVIELGQRFAATMQTTVSQVAGDFNRDGVVDLQDFQVWQAFEGSTLDARADGNNDGVVDDLDYAIWYSAVPEPEADTLAAIAVVVGGFFAWTQKRRTHARMQPVWAVARTNRTASER